MYQLLKHIFFFGLLLLQNAFTYAQKLRFERYTVENGLQNNIVLAAAEDAKGLMWFATTTGIDRFDGYNFVHYPLPQKSGGYPAYGQISFLVSDSRKQIWAASPANIYHYNVKKDRFELPPVLNNWLEKNKTITGLYSGQSTSSLFIAFNNGIGVFDSTGTVHTTDKSFAQYVRAIFQDRQGIIWAGTNKGLYRFIMNGPLLTALIDQPPPLEKLVNTAITGISQDYRDRYWIVTANNVLFLYDAAGNSLQQVNLSAAGAGRYAIKDVFHFADPRQTCIALDGGGLLFLNEKLDISSVCQTNEDDPATLGNNAAYDIFMDHHKRLWVTTYGGGVNVVIPEVLPFKNFTHIINNNNSLSNNAAKAIAEDADGNLWFGTRKGISKLTPGTMQWRHFNEDLKLPGFTGDNILALTGNGNTIWAGVYGGGIMRINAQTGQVKSYTTEGKDSAGPGTNFVYTLLYDSKGRLWAGGIRGPLSYMDTRTEKFTRVPTTASGINCIIEDARGNILTGTEKGVFRVNENGIENFFPGVVTEKVISILEYSPGKYWIGTLGGGLLVVSHEKGIEKNYRSDQGLPSDVISSLVKDNNGDVWIGTSRGVVHYQQKTNTLTSYTRADGLAGSQVNYGAAFKTSRGELVFGTTDGFSLFDPHNIRIRGYAPQIVFTGLTVNNKRINAYDNEGPLPEQLDELEVLRLKYFENSFSIDFVNTSPAVSGKHLYSWKLDGFDDYWSQPSITPSAVYTNLPNGKYVLLVKAFSKGQQENAAIRKLRIIIKAPWWRTIWAYIAYLLIAAAGIHLAYQYWRNRNARRKFAERLRLNTSISHEIRTPLTLIKGPVNALAREQHLTEAQHTNLELAQKNILKLEAIISQFIDFQKTGLDKQQMQVKNADMLPLLDDVTQSFQPLMKEKNIHFTYRRPSGTVTLLFDRDKMEKVLNNLISNAVKYTPPGREITVDAFTENGQFIIRVSDTGIGIPERQQDLLFKGYFRADNTTNLKETGSGIGLTVTRELVELHHGKITFSSTQNKGTVFTVKLPLHNEALQKFLVKDDGRENHLQIPAIQPAPAGSAANKKILIAEDHDELRLYLQKEIALAGYTVLVAADGREALELAGKELPDLVITDVMMPEMNGFQLCTALKKNLVTSHIPVIMLTAIHDRDYLLEGYRCGADDYVKKPFDPAYMLVRIENLLLNRTRFQQKVMNVFEHEERVVQEDTDMAWLKLVTSHIADNLESRDFSVEKLSSMLAMSRPVFFRKFKAITGEAPQQYIIQVRLRRAVELLQVRTYNISEVAYMCGFEDPKYFSTVFKKHFGKTPSEYLQEIK